MLIASAAVVALPVSDLTARAGRQMAERWRRGDRVPAEVIFAEHRELLGEPEAAVQIIYEEICLREELGDKTAVVEVAQRFPQYREQLELVMDCHRLLKPETGPTRLPLSGETWGDFLLEHQLGDGAQGRVFLARQRSLADRLVVLKFTPRIGGEHLSLARLQHTHIVPLYFVEDDEERNLRALGMPYFGGATLDRLLSMMSTPADKRSARKLLQALDDAAALYPPPSQAAGGPFRAMLARASYVEAMCWIGVWLADGLQYAHDRGLIHLDIKPSNVLLSADAQPMLLDFHLAQQTVAAHGAAPARMGGTPGYMSPEQAGAFQALRRRQPLLVPIDRRSDVYGLGVLLYEALAGKLPRPMLRSPGSNTRPGEKTRRRPAERLQQLNPQVSIGLADIIHRCLEERAEERYASAAELAEDLKRHLGHLPLKHAPNRSWLERWRKWRHRRPEMLPRARLATAVLLACLALVLLVGGRYRQRLSEARFALDRGRQHLHQQQYADAVEVLDRGLQYAEGLLLSHALIEDLRTEQRLAERALIAGRLHDCAERLRFLVGLDRAPAESLEQLAKEAAGHWEARVKLLDDKSASLPPEIEQRIAPDLLDVALLWTELQVRQATAADEPQALRQALDVLSEAESRFGESRAIAQKCARYAAALGMSDMATEALRKAARHNPRSAWQYYADGRALLQDGDYAKAEAQFVKAVELEPGAFWANYYLGVCAYRQGRPAEASQSFTVCVALSPGSAWCFYNRALAYAAMKKVNLALQDYDRALRLDPTFAPAWRNRGVLRYQQEHYYEALRDLQQALGHGAEPASVHFDLAAVHIARKSRDEAITHLRAALNINPAYREAQVLLEQLQPVR